MTTPAAPRALGHPSIMHPMEQCRGSPGSTAGWEELSLEADVTIRPSIHQKGVGEVSGQIKKHMGYLTLE